MMYDLCRIKQYMTVEVSKAGGKTTELRVVAFPVGLGPLPYPGSLLDQPVYVYEAFEQFIAAERTIAAKKLSR